MMNEINLTRVDLNLLVLFEAVFRERHVGRAADQLNLSTSAVSHGLSRLRRTLNDPLFLKTPKGVVPTERAIATAPMVDDALRTVRTIVGRAEPFDPATSGRRLVVGAPDGVSGVFLRPFMAAIRSEAPGIDIGIRQLLPLPNEPGPTRAWSNAFRELDARALDIAVIPSAEGPLRFARRDLYDEDFVLALRPDHPYCERPGMSAYCDALHLVVSHSGDPHGFVDDILANDGLSRRVALTVPNFMFACAVLADTDLICAIPRRFANQFAPRFSLAIVEAPLPLGRFRLNAFISNAAQQDRGLIWLLDRLHAAAARG